MSCVEVANSIAHKGRETFRQASKAIGNGPWNAQVVYGDTDCLFTRLPGCSKNDVSRIGQEMAGYVTWMNPGPIKLEFERTNTTPVSCKQRSGTWDIPMTGRNRLYRRRRERDQTGLGRYMSRFVEDFGEVSEITIRTLVSRYCPAFFATSSDSDSSTLGFDLGFHPRPVCRGMYGYRLNAAVSALSIARQHLSRDCRSESRVAII